MARRSRKAEQFRQRSEPTEAREALEYHWDARRQENPRLATMVTAEGSHHEPLHRWLRYRQAFAPELVRHFLRENQWLPVDGPRGFVLDPFAGSGTVPLECGRLKITAMGVDAVAALAYLHAAYYARTVPPLPALPDSEDWRDYAPLLHEDTHRVALMLAVARLHTTSGKLNRGALPLHRLFPEVIAQMRDDLRLPVPVHNKQVQGDARHLTMLEDESVDAIVTSPPYLSRHDYNKITHPLEQVYQYWYHAQPPDVIHPMTVDVMPSEDTPEEHDNMIDDGDEDDSDDFDNMICDDDDSTTTPEAPQQIRAHTRLRNHRSLEGQPRYHPAVEEPARWLASQGEKKLANLLYAYMDDMRPVLQEMHRVLHGHAPCWLVIGGARFQDSYIPADLYIAELAQQVGFEVEGVFVARDLVGARRKFGRLGSIAPRESVLVMTKR